jgi:hypothetical protein
MRKNIFISDVMIIAKIRAQYSSALLKKGA